MHIIEFSEPVVKQSLRKSRGPEELPKQKTSLALEKIARAIEECAGEHYFPIRGDKTDCDFCSVRDGCRKFFDGYAVNLGEQKYSKYSLEEAITQFNQIRNLKKLKKEMRDADK